jgi:hypothetical protein
MSVYFQPAATLCRTLSHMRKLLRNGQEKEEDANY